MKVWSKLKGTVALLALLGISVSQAEAESLADVMVEAYLNSPEIAGQRANVKVASEQAVQARAGGRVNVDGTIEIGVEATDSNIRNGLVYPTSLQLTAIQPLYTGGQVENATEAAETRITAQEAVLVATEQEVLLDAVTAFSDVRRDIFLVDLGQNNVRVLREQLRAAQERFEVGEVTRTDVEQAQARLAAARSDLAGAKGQLDISRRAFTRAVGRAPGDLDPPPPLPPLPASLDEAIALAMQNEPNLLASRLERQASGSDVRAAIGTLLPQVSLQGQLTEFDTLDDQIQGTQSASISLVVNIPFYSGGRNYSAVRQAQAQVESAEASITTTMRDAAQNVGIAWAQFDVAKASIKAGRLEVRAARLAFDGVTEEAKVGARTTLDVLDAEQEVLNARGDLIRAQRNEFVAAYSLLASMGLLTVSHLGLDTGEVAAESKYYDTVRDRNFGYDQSDDTVWSLSWRP